MGGPYTDVAVTAQVQNHGATGGAVLGLRLGGYMGGVPSQGYIAEVNGDGTVALFESAGFGQLGSTYTLPGYAVGQAVTLTLRAEGEVLTVQVNGVTVITATDDAFLVGEVGAWSYQPPSVGVHRFDDFRVEPLGAFSAAAITYTYDPLHRLSVPVI